MKKIHILGGGTVFHIKNHLALSAPAYGGTAKQLTTMCSELWKETAVVETHLTKMCGGDMETVEDVDNKLKELTKDPDTKVIVMSCAILDFVPFCAKHGKNWSFLPKLDKHSGRLTSSTNDTLDIHCTSLKTKLLKQVRETRKDIFLVSFKATCGSTPQEMYEAGLRLCKESSCNLVMVNDAVSRLNMIVTPEEAAYHETRDRKAVLMALAEISYLRSHLTFTRSTVIAGAPVPWSSDEVPVSLRKVVNYCITKNSYKPFLHATVGHFAHKISDSEFLTSIRKSNFNDLAKTGLVRVKTDGPDTVLAYGAKPSVGGQSQRIVFHDHPGYDCIVHFHCPLKANPKDKIPTVSQREVECGSHECGRNTSKGLAEFPEYGVKAVYLDSHGPNIVFNKEADPAKVIQFIENNFDLHLKTGGYNLNVTKDKS